MRIFYYLTCNAFNLLIFFCIFRYGSDSVKLAFNKIDIVFSIIPLFLTLGIERVYIYDHANSDHRHDIHRALTQLLVFSSIFMAASIGPFMPIGLIGVGLAFLYAIVNINTAYMNVSNDRNLANCSEALVRLMLIIAYIMTIEFKLLLLTVNSLGLFLFAACVISFLASVSEFKGPFRTWWVLRKYFSKSKYILVLIVLGSLYGNFPRFFELAFGVESRSVQFFFWLKLISYVGAGGLLFNYFIAKSFIEDRGFSALGSMPAISVWAYAILMIFLNFLNIIAPFEVLLSNKIEPLLLMILSMTFLVIYIKDVYAENLLSLELGFDKKLVVFLGVFAVALLLLLLAHFFGVLNTYSMSLIFLITSILWFVLSLLKIPSEKRNTDTANSLKVIAFVIGIYGVMLSWR